MQDDIYTCFCCYKFYNLQERRPFQLSCGDIICLQCYNAQKDQIQNQQVQCPFDNNHLCPVDQPPTESLFMMRYLLKNDFYLIKCDDHPNENANTYCKQTNKLVCLRCLREDPHPHFIQNKKLHIHKMEQDQYQQIYEIFDVLDWIYLSIYLISLILFTYYGIIELISNRNYCKYKEMAQYFKSVQKQVKANDIHEIINLFSYTN
ncbi:tldc domain-containing protein [Stylonychia lemnae]|uniref:Tldc domain-containing protein n=1 Tax=Stylonychia lemnae TaxID=5949 RepID=A0A078ADR9_STYLE|nr:tldc domain-containing protein [Stylonychia lemnae]|eukprot:CDW80369.1 tldc domain-containing protein [Stylonychia lemnae]